MPASPIDLPIGLKLRFSTWIRCNVVMKMEEKLR
jgi:hypothetical protein